MQYLRIKDIMNVNRGASPRPISNTDFFSDNGKYGWVRISDVSKTNKYLVSIDEYLSDLGSSFSVKLDNPTLFLSIAGSVGKACINKIPVCIHDGFVYFTKLKKYDIDYLFWFFSNTKIYDGLGKKGVFLNLNIDTIKNILVPKITMDEQKKISKFLDENCSKIDTEITLLEKKSILLDEYKNALIYETVTKGLDKNAEMKDSGVEWIGEIPNSWKVRRIKDYYFLGMGNTILKEDLIDDGLYPVYSATAEDKFFGYVNNINLTLKFGDLIIPARGNSIGYVKIIKTSNLHTCTQTTIYAKNKQSKRNSYYYYYMIGNKDKLFPYDKTAIPQITVSQVKGKILLVPTEQEQIEIADFLDLETKKIEKQIELINKKVELLKEYKQSLIYEAVTGQLEIE